ncbi:cystathionine gamma-synthase [Cylindrobasidium torrendii FP15055 ss-10]|uniref:Cystathionine gamma-synthase n=1 Tax=Cylindrobasidium torrendii FP15055 ss-10 TaxID=1314674 RepID=A0A0D7BVJ4_9AGAR|nr:cystathionine gamma-synthase [Cylindrobasidium torrendii FP15055 ss-10]
MSTNPSPTVSGTVLIHGDHGVGKEGPEVAPPISVSTTFKAGPNEVIEIDDFMNPEKHVYSRYSQDVSTRVEHIIGGISGGYALTYASGLAAAFSAAVHLKPKRIAIRRGYFGCHAAIEVYARSKDGGVPLIDLDDEYQPGDLCWLETPVNPTGEARDIKYYADKIHKVGGKLLVDATFGPPPLQDPFKWGADIIFHSATKYFGGHSDLLAGLLISKTSEEWKKARSLEAWLLLRSLRTFHLRVARQSKTATALVQWLAKIAATPAGQTFDGVPGGVLTKVWHASVQGKDERGFDPASQLEGGWNATFSVRFATVEQAITFPHQTKNFIAATSLGGVESLVEYRARADPTEDPQLVRLSVGVEELEDLKQSIREGINAAKAVETKA